MPTKKKVKSDSEVPVEAKPPKETRLEFLQKLYQTLLDEGINTISTLEVKIQREQQNNL